jgi:rod shape-determining protein MreB
MLFLTPRIHVQISPQRLTVRNLKTGASVSEIPEVAIGGKPKKILATGGRRAW